MPKVSEARKRANKKWNDANQKILYDRIQLVATKGNKLVYQVHAAKQGESLNRFVNRAIEETIKRDNERNL